MEFVEIRFHKAEIEKLQAARLKDMQLDLNLGSLKLAAPDRLEIDFHFSLTYLPQIAVMKFAGQTVVSGKKDELSTLVSSWKKSKSLDPNFLKVLTSFLALHCEANGVLLAKIVNVVPPLIPQQVNLTKK